MGAFPFAAYRAIRFRAGPRCPRCGSREVAPWGGFSGRRRYYCHGCHRTFSDFTGTPFAYLKRLDAWPAYRACLFLATSIRRAAKLAGIHRDTAFRWRHRFLAAIRAAECPGRDRQPELAGAIHLGDNWLPYSEKGSRKLDRPARTSGFRGLSFQTEAAWIAIACGEERGAAAEVAGPRRPWAESFQRLLDGRTAPGSRLVGREGEYGAAAAVARRAGFLYERRAFGPGTRDLVAEFWRSFMVWLERFRGVATRYLDNYLRWHGWVAAPVPWRFPPAPWLTATTVPADRVPGSTADRPEPAWPRRLLPTTPLRLPP